MLKSLRFLLLACLTMVCGSVFAQEETTVTWLSSSGDALTTIYPDANISLKWEEGGGDFAPKYVNGSVYFYNGNRVTISGTADDVTIKKIVFTFSQGSASMVTCNSSGKNESTTGIVNNSTDMTSTWTGDEKSLIFRASARTGVRYISSIEVTYTGGSAAPVETAPNLNITADGIEDTYSIDDNSVFVVRYENKGTAAAENAKLTLTVDGVENASKTIGSLAIGASDFWNAKYDVSNLTAGDHTVVLAFTADNDNTEGDGVKSVTKTVNFTKAAPKATFEVTAAPVEVEFAAENIIIVANVKNTSEVDATDVVMNLWNNGVIATETIASIAAGENENVTFTVANPYDAAGNYTMQVMTEDNMYGCNVDITVKEAPLHVAITNMEAAAAQYNIQAASYVGATLKVTMQNKDDKEVRANLQILKTGTNEVVAEQEYKLEANQERTVEVLVNETVAGTYKYYANVTNSEDLQHVWPAMNAVQVTFVDAVEGIDFAISATPTATVDLDNGAFVSAVIENNGTMDAEEAVLKLFVDGEENNTVELGTIAAGKSKFQSIAYDVTKIEAGEHQVYVAVVAGKNEAQTEATTVTFTKKAPETSFTVTTDKKVEVADNVATVDIVATVTNTSEIDAENVEVKLYNGLNVLATETIATLAAGASQEVRMTLNTADFTPERDYDLHIIVADKAEAFLTLRVIDTTLGIAAAKAARGENGQIFTIDGKKAAAVKKGNIYVVNGKKVVVK